MVDLAKQTSVAANSEAQVLGNISSWQLDIVHRGRVPAVHVIREVLHLLDIHTQSKLSELITPSLHAILQARSDNRGIITSSEQSNVRSAGC